MGQVKTTGTYSSGVPYSGKDKSFVSEAFKKLSKPTWKKAPTMISLFAGCGGLDLPFHRAGYHCKLVNEFNVDAARTFERNFGIVAQALRFGCNRRMVHKRFRGGPQHVSSPPRKQN